MRTIPTAPDFSTYTLSQIIKFKYTETQKSSEISQATKMTYTVRLGQLNKFVTAYGLQNARYDLCIRKEVTRELVKYLFELQYSRESVRKTQDWFLRIVESWVPAGTAAPPKAKLPKKAKRPKIFTSEAEIEQLKKHPFKPNLQRIVDLYIAQCYAGISHKDVHLICRETYTLMDGFAFFDLSRSKNTSVSIIPAIPPLMEIVEKYNWQLPRISNQPYNRYIKKAFKMVGIKKYITTYASRRSMVMYYLEKTGGWEVPTIVAGHPNSKVTAEYYADYPKILALKKVSDAGLFS